MVFSWSSPAKADDGDVPAAPVLEESVPVEPTDAVPVEAQSGWIDRLKKATEYIRTGDAESIASEAEEDLQHRLEEARFFEQDLGRQEQELVEEKAALAAEREDLAERGRLLTEMRTELVQCLTAAMGKEG